ncbi:MAG: prepilin peptidase [Planctomycetota bacterium]|nr:prepilin peptidase [Planctomycetota bacterium]
MADVIAWIFLTVALVAAGIDDWRTGLIHNRLIYPALVFGLLFWTCVGFRQNGFPGAADGFTRAFLAFLAGAAPTAVIFAAGGLGGGDIKLMGAIGAMTGRWECVLGAAVYGSVLAAVMALVLMVRKRIVAQTLRRVFGAALTAVAGVKPNLPDDSPRIPLGVPLGIGGILAGAEVLLGLRLPWTPVW